MKNHTVTLTAQQLAYLQDTVERRIETVKHNYRLPCKVAPPIDKLVEILTVLQQA